MHVHIEVHRPVHAEKTHFHNFTQWSLLAEATISVCGESVSAAINPL